MSTRNIPGGKGGRCVRLTTSPPSCVECHEIWELKPPGTLWAAPGLLRHSFTIMRSLNKSEIGIIVTLGYCITTTLPVTMPSPWTYFWPKRLFQWFHSPHNRLIWVRVTSSFSRNSNSTSKVVILELWTTSKRSWQTSWGHFHVKTSSPATGSGSNFFGGVRFPKLTTLKVIMLICSSVNKIFYSISLITF